MKLTRYLILLLILAALVPLSVHAQSDLQPTEDPNPTGVLLKTSDAFEGYTLFAPLIGDTAYLIDMDGQIVKTWGILEGTTSQDLYLLEDGTLIFQTPAQSPMLEQFAQVGGVAGSIKAQTWDGMLLWSYDYASDTYQQHHDIEPLPNGNILLIAWEVLSNEEALAAGMRPELLPDGDTLWPDKVVELDPTTGDIVWEWRVWDHLIQDYDPDLPNYGVVSEHPERIDINYTRQRVLGDWQHSNSIDYNPDLDQIVLSVRHFSEIWIIDHSTTTEEAAGSTGGRSNRGGDLLYRWGNPAAYQAGTAADQQLFYQHDATWIEPGKPGEGNILIFNNGDLETERLFSNVIEITPPLLDDGTYAWDGTVYAPAAPTWEYVADPPESLFAPFISGAQRLSNGNTMIVDGTGGHIFEVDAKGSIVWDFISPFTGGMQNNDIFVSHSLFRAYRYAPDYPGLSALFATHEQPQ